MTMPLPRRRFLAALTAAALPLRAQRPDASLTIRPDQELGLISPLLYGQFTEHIGRLIYEGIWVGRGSSIPNRNGYRLDTLEALKRIHPGVFRWPGGCFADTYHWEDGVGQRRVARPNHWWLRDEPNTFGTGEFMEWCESLGAQPYLSVNVGSGSVREALDWLEYCNGNSASGYAAMRRRNGREKPYGVRWWGIGNETWGCGGSFTPAEYAQQFRQYSVLFKRLGMTQGLDLVGVGHTEGDWNRRFLAALGGGLPYLDHLSIHRYFRRGHSTKFTDEEYTELMLDLSVFEDRIADALKAIDEVAAARARIRLFGALQPKPIGLVIDEWGVWDSDSKFEDGFRQNGVLREAIFAASCLNLFHQYASRITMTNIAQVIDCLQSLILTDGAGMTLTPTYFVYEMYGAHQGATAVRVDLGRSPLIGIGARTRPALSVSASKSGSRLLVTLVNQSPESGMDVEAKIAGASLRSARVKTLTGPSVRSENTKDAPQTVIPGESNLQLSGGVLRTTLPAHSVQAIALEL